MMSKMSLETRKAIRQSVRREMIEVHYAQGALSDKELHLIEIATIVAMDHTVIAFNHAITPSTPVDGDKTERREVG